MNWKLLAITVGLTVPLLAEGDDDLGLPQLDEPVPDPVPPAGYFVHDGQTYAIIEGAAVPLDREVTMRITPRNFIGFNGRPMRIPAGHMLMADGTLRRVTPPAAPAPAPVPGATAAVVPTATTPPIAIAPAVSAVRPEPPSAAVTGIAPVPATPPTTPPSAPIAASSITSVTVSPAAGPGANVTEHPITAPATLPPPQPSFSVPYRPDRTGPYVDGERPMDRTRPDGSPVQLDPTRMRDDQRRADVTRPVSSFIPVGDRTRPGRDDYRYRDRTMQGPDDERPPDPTRRPPR
jgi:hypothetical protein